MKFTGPSGVAYPHLHEDATSLQGAASSKLNLPKDIVPTSTQKGWKDEERNYSDEEIKNVFDFLDLDQNSYIGASELKHVLINMGELITDEEVDMMISMLDHGGDGQVNLQQFSAMVKSPVDSLELEKIHPAKLDIFTNIQENERCSLKIKVLSSFVVNNKIHKEDMLIMRDFFLEKGGISDSDDCDSEWSIAFDVLCKILPIENTGETRQLFDLFNEEGSKGKIDARELLLGLCNFIRAFSIQERCELMFNLYGAKDLDALTEKDISSILAANHLKSRNAVMRKANTVMKYAQNSEGYLSMVDFQDAATKFPNLLFPKHVKT